MADLKGKRILLVDDDEEILRAMTAALDGSGAEIKSVRDGHSALKAVAGGDPDVIVLDVMLPGRSGFLVLEKIRSGTPKGTRPHVIMITGNLGKRHQAYAEALGVDDYLNKPFAMERLLGSIERVCAE